jgi:hypothetical protein
LQKIEAANEQSLHKILQGEPVLIDIQPAAEVVEGIGEGLILHAGPPITWDRMCGPMRGAICGVAVFEGWADDLKEAETAAANGRFAFYPNHHFACVGPMTGMTTMGQPVMIVENRAFGNRAYCTINEGLGKVMRFGGNDAEVLDRLRLIRQVIGPALSAALKAAGGIPLNSIIARGLAMGDEMHQRNIACSVLLLRELAPYLAQTTTDSTKLVQVFNFIRSNDQFFLNVAMAMGKAMMDPVIGVSGSTIVTAMSRNGTDFGIRVSGTGERWFTAPVEMPKGLYFPGYSERDANPDMGDSAIVETIGLGGFAMATATAVAGFVGAGTAGDAAQFTRQMYEITIGRNPDWTMPNLDFAGVPTGIDIRKVLQTGIAPVINTGIAHKMAGIGQVGAGIVRAPLTCFERALEGIAETLPEEI